MFCIWDICVRWIWTYRGRREWGNSQPHTWKRRNRNQIKMKTNSKRPYKVWLYSHANHFLGWKGASYPNKAVMKHTSQVTLLTVLKVSVTTNCWHSGHCVLHGRGGRFSTSRITEGAVMKRNDLHLIFIWTWCRSEACPKSDSGTRWARGACSPCMFCYLKTLSPNRTVEMSISA